MKLMKHGPEAATSQQRSFSEYNPWIILYLPGSLVTDFWWNIIFCIFSMIFKQISKLISTFGINIAEHCRQASKVPFLKKNNYSLVAIHLIYFCHIMNHTDDDSDGLAGQSIPLNYSTAFVSLPFLHICITENFWFLPPVNSPRQWHFLKLYALNNFDFKSSWFHAVHTSNNIICTGSCQADASWFIAGFE